MEIWKDIKDYEGLYQVSNLGRVKSSVRVRVPKERILRTSKTKKGYVTITLTKEGKNKTFNIHQLVAICFLDHIPCGMIIIVDHKNNIRTDNRVKNLQLTTNRHNSSKDKKGDTSKYIGVSWSKGNSKWKSAATINRKTKHFGYFTDESEASNAYQEAINKL